MSVSDRVREAIDCLQRGQPTNALIQVSIAIDATAKALYPRDKVGQRCKKFLRENQALITLFGLGFLDIHGDIHYSWPDDPRGYKTQEEVLYNVVRCSLLHDGELDERVRLTHERVLGSERGGIVLLSTHIITGLILAVVASTPAKYPMPAHYTITVGGATYPMSEFWGKKKELYEIAKRASRKD